MTLTPDHLETLKALLALAVADDTITAGERGVFESLAERIGVRKPMLEAMVQQAREDATFRQQAILSCVPNPRQALELLVGTARIDGEISDEEERLLAEVASAWGIREPEFRTIYDAGVARADKLRQQRGSKPQ